MGGTMANVIVPSFKQLAKQASIKSAALASTMFFG